MRLVKRWDDFPGEKAGSLRRGLGFRQAAIADDLVISPEFRLARAAGLPQAGGTMKAPLLLASVCLSTCFSWWPLHAQTPEETVTLAEEAVQNLPGDVAALSEAGDANLFAGRYREAVEHFRKMIEVDPSQDAPHWRLGIALYFDRQYAAASAQFAKYHRYDGRDRENGLWKFLADVRVVGLEQARKKMLVYAAFDREPFPSLYALYAGQLTPEQFVAHLAKPRVQGQPRAVFFGHYYLGLYHEVCEQREAALETLKKAVALYTPETAESGGPGYMWRVAKVHRGWLAAETRAAQ